MAEAEARISLLFKQIDSDFKQIDKISDLDASESKLSTVVEKLKEAKGLVLQYEREAILDGLDSNSIKATKTRMVKQMNTYVTQKKDVSNRIRARREQSGAATNAASPYKAGPSAPSQDTEMVPMRQRQQQLSNNEIITQGNKGMDDIDRELASGVRVVAETEEMAVKTAAQLKAQTDQMGRVIDDLNEIEFTMKRASKVIRDITRGLLTDKCIMCLLFIVVAAICIAIGLKIAGVGGDDINLPGTDENNRDESEATVGSTSNRRMLIDLVASTMARASQY